MTPRRHLSARRRVELMLPSLIALRLALVLIPVGDAERRAVDTAKDVFDATAMEVVDDLPATEAGALRSRGIRLRAWLLDRYAAQRRGGLTVLQAFTLWLDDLRRREIIHINDGCAFLTHWDDLADGILRHPDNVEGLQRGQRSATKMAAEWRRLLEGQGYYRTG
ncbi:hypothetical protein [Magnetospirillum sulfuroxidans]|uniref:Uncharacterized protein n=1 Tax=Magnetospirillum sulfuroxidans TaxID=611300 RepID=A0ABS5I936_9PROT|nr:hypothetical protein [Magnetospirillum sulfuroxidans]MBR9970834.1 hypothetical protein [Magnetospirillum sulfuroxidans]